MKHWFDGDDLNYRIMDLDKQFELEYGQEVFKEDSLDELDAQKDLKKIRREKEKRLFHRNDPQDLSWFPIFWKKRFLPEVEAGKIPKNPVILDFCSQNYPNPNEIPKGYRVVSYDFPKNFDGTLPYEDNAFDAIVSHGNTNRSQKVKPGTILHWKPRIYPTKKVKKRISEGKKTWKDYERQFMENIEEKAWCIMGGSHVNGVPWLIDKLVIERWREFYRISKDGCVFFLTCARHGKFWQWAEEIISEEDRQGKKINIVVF